MRRAVTIAEALVALAAAGMLMGVLLGAQGLLERQTKVASDGLDQAQAAVRLMEMFRLELSGLVMNPTDHPGDHMGNSLLVSPHGNAIQFVTERSERGKVHRYLVSYEAGGGDQKALKLTKKVWEFTQVEAWKQSVATTGWPAEWLGKQVENRQAEYDRLCLQDLRFQYLVPEDDAAQVYIRVKVVLKSPGGRLMPLTTLVSLPTPRAVATASSCPCVNAPCFDPSKPDCTCCFGESDDAGPSPDPAVPEPGEPAPDPGDDAGPSAPVADRSDPGSEEVPE